MQPNDSLAAALWRIYQRAERPLPWQADLGNLPWDDPAFSQRMLREHLNENHAAASRQSADRARQIAWLWEKMALQPGDSILDMTCGPGLYSVPLAERGCTVTGIDFSPASIAYARELAAASGVSERCTFVQSNVHGLELGTAVYQAALLIYGQMAVMTRAEAQELLRRIAQALQPGGRLCLELLNPDRVDKGQHTWWFTDDKGLWGERPYLHLGERFWLADERMSIERFHTIHLETGAVDVVELCDQTYTPEEVAEMLHTAGFTAVTSHPAWDNLPLHDAAEWIVTLAVRQ